MRSNHEGSKRSSTKTGWEPSGLFSTKDTSGKQDSTDSYVHAVREARNPIEVANCDGNNQA